MADTQGTTQHTPEVREDEDGHATCIRCDLTAFTVRDLLDMHDALPQRPVAFDAEATADALRDAVSRIRYCADRHSAPFTSAVRETVLILDSLADALSNGPVTFDDGTEV